MSTPTVLFLCQHNAGRSQLGAALLEILAPGDYTVAELDLDISSRSPRAVTIDDLANADIVVAMKPGLALPATPAGRHLEWSFPDPTDWTAENVRPLRDAVADRIRKEILTT